MSNPNGQASNTDPRVTYARHCVRGAFKTGLSALATEQLLAAYDELAASVRDRDRLLAELADDEPCQFDHHGGCQEHGFLDLEPGETCPMRDVQQLLRDKES